MNAGVGALRGPLEPRATHDRPQRPFVDLEDEVDHGDGLSDPEHGGRRGCHVSSQAESHGIWTRDDVVEAEAPLGVG